MNSRERSIAALAKDGDSLSDYVEGAVLVFVDGELHADSEDLPGGKAMVKTARSYGEVGCWWYQVQASDA